jgi:alkanesulfonate monooxygenase SsuD/methylene tetrahydromethanopterin reductase-like flavin-dependent oxidoreductase (luciferase family)
MDLKKPKKVVLAAREAIEIVRAAAHKQLNNGDHGYKGEIYNVNYPCAYDWLKAPAPMIYGTAYRPMMMRMEGRVADGVYVGCTPPEVMEAAMEQVRTGISRRDNPNDAVRANTFWAWHIKEDRDEAYRESRRELAWRARKLDAEMVAMYCNEEETQMVRDNYDAFVAAWFDRSGNVQGVPEELCNRLCEGLTSTGGLDDIDREVERYKLFGKAGLTEVALRLHDNPMDALKIIGERVVPALKDA